MYVLLNSIDAKSNSGDVAANNTSLDPASAALIAALRNRAKVSILQKYIQGEGGPSGRGQAFVDNEMRIAL